MRKLPVTKVKSITKPGRVRVCSWRSMGRRNRKASGAFSP